MNSHTEGASRKLVPRLAPIGASPWVGRKRQNGGNPQTKKHSIETQKSRGKPAKTKHGKTRETVATQVKGVNKIPVLTGWSNMAMRIHWTYRRTWPTGCAMKTRETLTSYLLLWKTKCILYKFVTEWLSWVWRTIRSNKETGAVTRDVEAVDFGAASTASASIL